MTISVHTAMLGDRRAFRYEIQAPDGDYKATAGFGPSVSKAEFEGHAWTLLVTGPQGAELSEKQLMAIKRRLLSHVPMRLGRHIFDGHGVTYELWEVSAVVTGYQLN